MKKTLIAMAAAMLATTTVHATEFYISPNTMIGLDHVFFIMMENKTDVDILNNPNAPFINAWAGTVPNASLSKVIANRATNYFGVGHPSAPNYLEAVGGSNFGVNNDVWPNWVNGGCVDNAPSTGCGGAFTPIAVAGVDNAVVATATSSSQCNGQISLSGTPAPNNCALYNYPSTGFTPKSIADQLVAVGKSWKAYEENLPMIHASPIVDGINYSDGTRTNLSPVADFAPGAIQKLYAVKHNPFVYFSNIQQGTNPLLSYNQIQGFEGVEGLWADLQQHPLIGNVVFGQNESHVPNFSLIVPDQCGDMHGGVSGGTPICSAGTSAEAQLLIAQGDSEVQKLVNGIKASDAWKSGRNAIVMTYDENDFSNEANRVVFLVETNYGPNGRVSNVAYDHFSLLRTLEAAFGLPCLNHACDLTSKIMSDLF